jgi:3-oxoacyl-[acyl-carrier-protein] synthase II
VATTWRALQDGVSGASGITKFDPAIFPVRFACEVKGFDPLKSMDRKEAKRADHYTQYAVAASVEAMADAGLSAGGYDVDRTGVIVGSGIGGLKSFEEQHDIYRERGPSKISPFFIPMFIADIAAGVVSMRFNARGPNYATVSACSTSAHAIGDAFRTIQYGDADVMICGGSEATVTPMAIGGFANMTALSTRNDSPATASRPFDKERDGFVMAKVRVSSSSSRSSMHSRAARRSTVKWSAIAPLATPIISLASCRSTKDFSAPCAEPCRTAV